VDEDRPEGQPEGGSKEEPNDGDEVSRVLDYVVCREFSPEDLAGLEQAFRTATAAHHTHVRVWRSGLPRGKHVVSTPDGSVVYDYDRGSVSIWNDVHAVTQCASRAPIRAGEWVLQWAEVIFGRSRCERIFDQIVSDMRIEIAQARENGRLAVLFAIIRGYVAVAKAAGAANILRFLLRYEVFKHIL